MLVDFHTLGPKPTHSVRIHTSWFLLSWEVESYPLWWVTHTPLTQILVILLEIMADFEELASRQRAGLKGTCQFLSVCFLDRHLGRRQKRTISASECVRVWRWLRSSRASPFLNDIHVVAVAWDFTLVCRVSISPLITWIILAWHHEFTHPFFKILIEPHHRSALLTQVCSNTGKGLHHKPGFLLYPSCPYQVHCSCHVICLLMTRGISWVALSALWKYWMGKKQINSW